MRLIAVWLAIGLLILQPLTIAAQENEDENHGHYHKHRAMLVLGHAYVSSGINKEGDKSWLVVPSWGIDYDYRLNKVWSVGLHSDFVVENYEVEEEGGIVQDRNRPFTATMCLSRKFGAHFAVVAGGGVELAPEDNLAVVRLGADYAWELPSNWELAVSLVTDYKVRHYVSWVFGFGIGKNF